MSYSQKLRTLFPEISLTWEDLLLLETIQVKSLPDRVNPDDFAVLIRNYPVAYRILCAKYPPVSPFLDSILEGLPSLADPQDIEDQCQEALWEIADLIIYNKYPDIFDALAPIAWRLEDISSLAPLQGKVVADVGAGSGRIAFLVAPAATTVFAVEPIGSFRSFMKKKARIQRAENIFVVDGTLDSVPLPENSLDILITSNAIGWNLEEELVEIERVLKPGGHAIHLLQQEREQDNPMHRILIHPPWNYKCLEKEEGSKRKLRYHKVIGEH